MKRAQIVIGLLSIVTFTAGFLLLIRWLFTSVNPAIVTATVGAFATIVVSTLTVVYGRRQEKKDEIERELRNQKVPIYEQFITDYLVKLGFLGKTSDGSTAEQKTDSQPSPSPEMVNFFREQTPKLMVWASDDVLKSWSTLKNTGAEVDTQTHIARMAALFRAVREDLGHSGDATDEQLLGLFINDAYRPDNE